MQFGQANVDSDFPPTSGHDHSANAVDNIVPRTVVIAVNGTVTFNVPPGVHQINIYKPGTQPEDVDMSMGNLTTLAAVPGAARHCQRRSRVLRSSLTRRRQLPGGDSGAVFDADGDDLHVHPPGKYLVICAFLPHFQGGMYAWVEVKEA